jgi:riboflavin kinase/FMN adenylyltransferase
MRLVNDLTELKRGRPSIVTIGAFDGVHRGHQVLIREVVERARALDFQSVILTFDPRPEVVFRPESLQLTDGREKARIIAALRPDILALLPFNRLVSQILAPDFLATLLDHVDMKEIWVGADFAFGHNRGGTIDFLIESGQKSHFDVHVLHRRPLLDMPISSSLVRRLIGEGDVSGAALLLGHHFGVHGPVVHGAGRGRQLGYPTANIEMPPHQILPATGVYAGYVRLGERRLPAAASIGYNVQFEGRQIVVEAHILDFDEDIYGEEIGLDLVARVREEQKFESVEALVAQIGRDVETTRRLLATAEEPGELMLS